MRLLSVALGGRRLRAARPQSLGPLVSASGMSEKRVSARAKREMGAQDFTYVVVHLKGCDDPLVRVNQCPNEILVGHQLKVTINIDYFMINTCAVLMTCLDIPYNGFTDSLGFGQAFLDSRVVLNRLFLAIHEL